jgi:hypothetical protein
MQHASVNVQLGAGAAAGVAVGVLSCILYWTRAWLHGKLSLARLLSDVSVEQYILAGHMLCVTKGFALLVF